MTINISTQIVHILIIYRPNYYNDKITYYDKIINITIGINQLKSQDYTANISELLINTNIQATAKTSDGYLDHITLLYLTNPMSIRCTRVVGFTLSLEINIIISIMIC